jgi:dienelactone hydrolase
MFVDSVPLPDAHTGVEGLLFLLKSGRAVMLPEFKGGYELREDLVSDTPNMSAQYRDYVAAWVKELGRSVDYLETRPEVDRSKLAYVGSSLGARMAPVMIALEDGLKVALLQLGGFKLQVSSPKVDPFNFAPRVKIPVLLLSGRFDFLFPVETAQKPFFHLIGTPPEHKRHAIYETSHGVPTNERIKEDLDWLDRYFGASK